MKVKETAEGELVDEARALAESPSTKERRFKRAFPAPIEKEKKKKMNVKSEIIKYLKEEERKREGEEGGQGEGGQGRAGGIFGEAWENLPLSFCVHRDKYTI